MEDKNEGLEDIIQKIDIIRGEVRNKENAKREINPYFTEYILEKLEKIEELPLEDILEKIDFLYKQIKGQYEQDIKPDFGEHLVGILDEIIEIIGKMNKENLLKQNGSFVPQVEVDENKAVKTAETVAMQGKIEDVAKKGEEDGTSKDRESI